MYDTEKNVECHLEMFKEKTCHDTVLLYIYSAILEHEIQGTKCLLTITKLKTIYFAEKSFSFILALLGYHTV